MSEAPDVLVGLTTAQVRELQSRYGKNEVAAHKTTAISVLIRQLRNPILWLLCAALVTNQGVSTLTFNKEGACRLRATAPALADSYSDLKLTLSFKIR